MGSRQDKHKGQFSQLSPSKDAISLLLIVDMKECRVSQFFSSLESLDHKYGPMYLIECFQYLAVQNLGIFLYLKVRNLDISSYLLLEFKHITLGILILIHFCFLE